MRRMMTRRWKWIGVAVLGFAVLASPLGGQTVNTQIAIAVNALITGVTPYTRLRITASDYINWGTGSDATGYGLRDNGGNIQVKNSGGTWATITGSGGNPIDASYWTRVSETSLTNETAMSSLATALILNTTTTGVPVAYAGTSCTNQFVRSLSLVGAATCATVALATDTSGTLTVARGGTGLTAGTSGGILAYTAAGTLASSAALTDNILIVGGGAGVVPNSLAAGLGTTTQLLHGNAGGEPTWAAASLTADVSGILPTANGGTGIAYFTAAGPTVARVYTFPDAATTILTTNAAVTAAQGGTGQTSYTIGDLLYASGATALSKLADIATGNALLSGGIGVAPAWGKIGLTTHVSGTLPIANGGTGLTSYTTGDLLYAVNGTTLGGRAAVATGQVLISQGAATAPAYSADPTVTSIQAPTVKLTTVVTFSGTAPTISSGFGTGPSVAGTAAAFRINVGTGGIATSGVIGLPAAGTGWVCNVVNLTAAAANRADIRTIQTGSTGTTVTLQNQTISSGAAAAWGSADSIAGSCAAF